jgi:hypothetical protein
MSTESNDGLRTDLQAGKLAIGNVVVTSTGAISTVSSNTYVDSLGKLASGALPFELPLYAGVTDTSYSVLKARSTTMSTADVGMLCTLVKGASTSLTTAGFLRITIADDNTDAGGLTSGNYYIPFGTLA